MNRFRVSYLTRRGALVSVELPARDAQQAKTFVGYESQRIECVNLNPASGGGSKRG